MAYLNYHHLRYFREVAVDGQLGRTADRLNVSQSALSIQIKKLEDSLGVALFERVSRKLVLTEAGRIALDYADQIFGAGDQLLATLGEGGTFQPPLRVGAISTLSRNFQLHFLRPLFADGSYRFILKSGNKQSLLDDLKTFNIDVFLSTEVPDLEEGSTFSAQKVAEQPVLIHGRKDRITYKTLKDLLQNEPVILPTENTISSGFNNLVAGLGVKPLVAANVDDMAMVRLLAREGVGLAIAPSVVLADELRAGTLATANFDLGLSEPFFAVTLSGRFTHPALTDLLGKTGL